MFDSLAFLKNFWGSEIFSEELFGEPIGEIIKGKGNGKELWAFHRNNRCSQLIN